MNYNIHIDNFDGPMDLLLHLVKSTKLDIYEIKMSEIIESYLEYIHSMQVLNIDVGSEFLLMAASLVHLKSKKLIGKTEEDESSDDEFQIASEEDLKNKLIQYEKYKEVTKELQELEEKRNQVYTKIPESLKEYQVIPELVNEGVTIDDLITALKNVEERLHYKEPLEAKITKKEINVKDRVIKIRSILNIRKRCYFEDLFEYASKEYIIATFLAILEMSKAKEIKLIQEKILGTIEVEALS